MTRFRLKKWEYPAAALLLLLHLALMIGFIRNNDLTIDEPVHILGGLEILQNGGHTMNPESGVFPQVWSALPICGAISMPPSGTMETLHSAPYPFARHIFFHEDADRRVREITEPETDSSGNGEHETELVYPERLFFLSRLNMSLLSLACGFLIFLATRELCGRTPALMTLGLYVFYPLYLSNGPLATADMASSLFFLSSLFFFLRFLRRPGLWNLLLTGASLSLLFLSKMSAAVIAAVFVILILIKVFSRSPMKLCLRRGKKVVLRERLPKLGVCMLGCVILTIMLFLSIWTAYGWRREFPPIPEDARAVRLFEQARNISGPIPEAVRFLKLENILPQPYLYGFLHMYFYSQARWSFLDGEVSREGHALFFPLAFLYKTPPPLLLVFLAAIAGMGLSARTCFGRKRLVLLLPYLIFAGIFAFSALNTHLNIGYRHLMPAITLFFPLSGMGFRWMTGSLRRITEGGKKGKSRFRFLKYAPWIFCVWNAGESLAVYPHSLAYFSSFFGGPEQAYFHLVDSSLDWGQDGKNIRPVLEQHGVPTDGSVPLYFAFFTSIPEEFCGLENARHIHFGSSNLKETLFEFTPGYYIISATYLRGYSANTNTGLYLKRPDILSDLKNVFYAAFDAVRDSRPLPVLPEEDMDLDRMCIEYQSFRFEILRRGLERMKPEFHVHYSIYVYRLDKTQLKKILKDLIR